MHDSVALPLQHRHVFRSRDPDETGAFMATKEFRLDCRRARRRRSISLPTLLTCPAVYLGYIQYGSAATIHVPDVRARDDYWVQLPVRGACEITNNAGSVVCAPGHAVV